MNIDSGYDPKTQKMAVFLRERCERGKYGLKYMDENKNLVSIPWPTVPRQNEEVSDSFGMFTEWAVLSFRKRGNRVEQAEKEPLGAQKHRFRNALARADGLRHCKELSTDIVRVYEFVDTKKEKAYLENGQPQFCGNSSPNSYSYHPADWVQHPLPQADLTDSNSALSEWDAAYGSPNTNTLTSSPNQVPSYMPETYQAQPGQMQMAAMPLDCLEEQMPSLETLINELIIKPPASSYPLPQPAAHPIAPQGSNYEVNPASQHHFYPVAQQQAPQPEPHLVAKVFFLGEEVLNRPVCDSKGFRLYSGNNVPDMRRLLDDRQRSQLQMQTRYNCDELFGPESFDQVEMPLPRSLAHGQTSRTFEVVHNMDRGVIFCLDFQPSNGMPYNAPGIPNVFAIRLCQTRVFPYDTNVLKNAVLETEGLKRMQWEQIFDGAEFAREMRKWMDGAVSTTPSSTISLSVGQKPKREKGGDSNLVTVKIVVAKAKQTIKQHIDQNMEDICISDKSSMDKAAQQHKDEVQARMMFDDTQTY